MILPPHRRSPHRKAIAKAIQELADLRKNDPKAYEARNREIRRPHGANRSRLIVARSGTPAEYGKNVFINCPFDDDYRPIFRAIVFTVAAAGYVTRCTLEHEDASQVRITKIFRLIADSALSIHDVSRTELDEANQLPRFNMPLELGAFLGAKHFGSLRHQRKRTAWF